MRTTHIRPQQLQEYGTHTARGYEVPALLVISCSYLLVPRVGFGGVTTAPLWTNCGTRFGHHRNFACTSEALVCDEALGAVETALAPPGPSFSLSGPFYSPKKIIIIIVVIDNFLFPSLPPGRSRSRSRSRSRGWRRSRAGAGGGATFMAAFPLEFLVAGKKLSRTDHKGGPNGP